MAVVSHEAVAPAPEETRNVATTTQTSMVGNLVPVQPEMAPSYNNNYADTENATTDNNNKIHDEGEEEEEDESFWDVVSTWYLPLLLLWLRRSMFGTANLVRSLIVGQCLKLLLTGDVPKWAQPFTDPRAWPPPAFTMLAILTFVAFVVHPDGLTWFMLGKLRDAILSILHSFASCWTMFIQDYGIVTTTIALMTLAGIGCLLGILLKNALPKTGSSNPQPEKKKKKRKGVKGKGGRIRQFRSSSSSSTTTKTIAENEPQVSLQEDEPQEQQQLTEPIAEAPQEQRPTTEMRASLLSAADTIPEVQETTATTTTTTTSAQSRSRKQTASTFDSIVGDDASCDSISVRSFASAPTAVTVGSTGKSDSEFSVPAKSRRERSRRKQQQNKQNKQQMDNDIINNNNNKSSKRGGRKVSSVETADKPVQHGRLSPRPTGARQDARHSNQVARPNTTGRFANLKEKDTRFDNPRRNHGRGNGNRARNHVGGRGKHHTAPQSSFAASPVMSPTTKQNSTSMRASAKVTTTPTSNHGSTVQFGSPYSASPDRQCQKKQEVAKLLGRVGLVGNDAASIVSNVADVDALARLSDVQLQIYGVSADKQVQLQKLLEEHRRRTTTATVRPPPGLSPIVHDEPPTLFGSPNRSHHIDAPVNLAPQFGGAQKSTFHPFAYDENEQQFGVMNDEDSRIEAELQELGGKMIGSVLDF